MSRDLQFNPLALQEVLKSDEARRFLGAVGREVRDRARGNARASVPSSGSESVDSAAAIISVPGEDDEGLYVDVGYSKHHPGFYLWWWEVGTRNHPARPHLRPALQPRD